ncbi:glycosyltransferase family 4 protein [Jeongeupia wiesaeckerbachi]|uniref:glycosyltransferase family 4 protein n=1 Tax=Jeongeupia wiesaeckerbachi TaxID=3051218 RepID=UPI003D8004C0
MKAILIVTEAYLIGGLETHIRGEVSALTQLGCQVHMAVGTAFNDMLRPIELVSLTTGVAMSPEASELDLVQSVELIRRIIRRNSIDCVHAHPFISLIPAFIAAALENVKFVVTLHGPSSLSGVYGPIYDFFVKSLIFPGSSLVISVSKEILQLTRPFLGSSNFALLPNGVEFSELGADVEYPFADTRWLLVSRLDDSKIIGIMDFILKAKASGIPGVAVVGDGSAKEGLVQWSKENDVEGFVEFLGFSDTVPNIMRKYAGVAGMGRVVLEGIAAEKCVAMVGYDGVKGIVDERLFDEAQYANFSGRHLEVINAEEFSKQISAAANLNRKAFRRKILSEHSEFNVWKSFLRKLRWRKPSRNNIAIDFYLSLRSSVEDAGPAPFLQSYSVLRRLGEVVHGRSNFETYLAGAYVLCKERFSHRD